MSFAIVLTKKKGKTCCLSTLFGSFHGTPRSRPKEGGPVLNNPLVLYEQLYAYTNLRSMALGPKKGGAGILGPSFRVAGRNRA